MGRELRGFCQPATLSGAPVRIKAASHCASGNQPNLYQLALRDLQYPRTGALAESAELANYHHEEPPMGGQGENWKSLEAHLKRHCTKLDKANRASVQKRTNPLRIIKMLSPAKFLCVPGRTEAVDFEGVLASGRAVYLEAKHTLQDISWPVSNLTDEQLAYMVRKAELNALCMVYLRRTDAEGERTNYLLPVGADGTLALCGHERCDRPGNNSIRFVDIEAYQVNHGETWLDAAERLYGTGHWPQH